MLDMLISGERRMDTLWELGSQGQILKRKICPSVFAWYAFYGAVRTTQAL